MSFYQQMKKVLIFFAIALYFSVVNAKGQDVGVDEVVEFYSRIPGIRFKVERTQEYSDGYFEYLKETESAPESKSLGKGTLEYTSFGGNYAFDCVRYWEDGARMYDERGAWNGKYHQLVRKMSPAGPTLVLSKKRDGWTEIHSTLLSPWNEAFRFLTSPSKYSTSGVFPPDNYETTTHFDAIKNRELWKSFAERIISTPKVEDLDGVPCVIVECGGGFHNVHRTIPITYRVWFPLDDRRMPVRLETWSADSNRRLLEVFDVTERGMAKGSGDFMFPYPKKSKVIVYDASLAYSDGPMLTRVSTVSEIKMIKDVPEGFFDIDPGAMKRIENLDTGQTILVK